MRKVVYNYYKPQKYYSKLITFLAFISFSLTVSLQFYFSYHPLVFLFQFIIIFFIILILSTIIELYYSGEYMDPIEIQTISLFVKRFLNEQENENEFYLKYIPKKNHIPLNEKKYYAISTIKKEKKQYIVHILHQKKMLEFFFIKFFSKHATKQLTIKKVKGKLQIIHII